MSALNALVNYYKYTQDELQRVLGIKQSLAKTFLEPLNSSCCIAEIKTKEQACMYLAQIGHESGCFRYTKELWGTQQQLKYEPPNALAKRLGNTQVGDGKRYMGRGLIQVTGRFNYKVITSELKKLIKCPDFVLNPDELSKPLYAALSAGLFWRIHKLNTYVAKNDFIGLTKKINGGTNGLAHRQSLYVQCLLNLH